MKKANRLMFGATAVFLLLTGVRAQKSATSETTEAAATREILQIEEERNHAIVNGDAAALDRMTSDDYTFITLRGEVRTKQEIVQGFRKGSFHYDARRISDLNVRI